MHITQVYVQCYIIYMYTNSNQIKLRTFPGMVAKSQTIKIRFQIQWNKLEINI